MEEENVEDKKKKLIGILDLVGIILSTAIGLIVKNLFFN